MTAELDGMTPSGTYALACTDCAFEATVEGDFHDAYDAADVHQQVHGDEPTEHFVNLRLHGHGR